MSEERDLKKLYEVLSAPFPEESIKRTKGQETKKGYDTSGVGYQFCVNRFNEVLGLDGWTFTEPDIVREHLGEFQSGRPRWEITVKLGITIMHNDEWLPTRYCYGGHVSGTHEDALKGALTNAFKKTAAFWGVGRQAYEGTLDDDLKPQEEGAATPTKPEPTDPEPTDPQPSSEKAELVSKLAGWASFHFPNDTNKQKDLISAVGSFTTKEGEVKWPKSLESIRNVKWLRTMWGRAKKIEDKADAEVLVQFGEYQMWKDSRKDEFFGGE